MILNTKQEGRRRVGKPQLRWLDDIEDDIKTLGVKKIEPENKKTEEMDGISKEDSG
jgi:hypothetical protein